MKLQLLIILILISPLTFAHGLEKKYNLSGKVVDGTAQEALEYATVSLADAEGKVLTGAITDAQGAFSIKVEGGTYRIKVDFLSFESFEKEVTLNANMDLGVIALQPDGKALEDVEIVDEKTTVEYKLDKKVYNVGKDITAQGGTVNDVLDNVPSVNVDADGAISLRGNSGVTVLVNGKPSVIAANNGLGQIPAQNVESIEVITNPSARYQASGTAGIVNIVLKRNKLKGISGSVQLTTGIPADHSATLNLSYKNEKFNLFGTVGRRYSNFVGKSYTDQFVTNGTTGTTTFLRQDGLQDRNDNGYNFFLGADYYFNAKNTLTAAFFQYNVKNTDVTDLDYAFTFSDGSPDSAVYRQIDYYEPQQYNQLELSYQKTFDKKGKKWTVDFQYDFWNDDENENITSREVGPMVDLTRSFRSRDVESSDDFLLQSDFVQPLGENGRIEFGGRAETRVITSQYSAEQLVGNGWEVINNIDNDVDYSERIGGLYFQYGNAFKKIDYLLGLRTEFTQIAIDDVENEFSTRKDYTRFFPTLHLNYGFSKSTKLQLSYSRRIRRPGFWQLNPFGGISNDNALFGGNPDLDPAFTNSLELGFLKNHEKFTFNPSIYFQHTTDFFHFFVERTDEGRFFTKPINLDHENRYGVEIAVNYRPLKWLQLSGEFNGYHTQQRGDYEMVNFDFDNTAWFTQFSTRMRLPQAFTFQGQFSYQGASQNAQTILRPQYYADLGLTKRFLKDKASLTFNVRNVLDSRRRIYLTTGEGFSIEEMNQRNIRRYRLSFIYQFNRKPNQRDRQPGRSNR